MSETSKLDFATIYGIRPENIEVTYESAHPSFDKKPTLHQIRELKKKYGIENEFILYTGGLKRHKTLRILLKSFAILVKDYGFKGDLVIMGAN